MKFYSQRLHKGTPINCSTLGMVPDKPVCFVTCMWDGKLVKGNLYFFFLHNFPIVCVCVCERERERECMYAYMCMHACVHDAYVHQESNIWRIAKIFANLTIDPDIQLGAFIVLICNLYNLQTHVCVSTCCCVAIWHYSTLSLTWNWKNTSFHVTYLLCNFYICNWVYCIHVPDHTL